MISSRKRNHQPRNLDQIKNHLCPSRTREDKRRECGDGLDVIRFALSHEHTEMKSHCRLRSAGRFHVICRAYKKTMMMILLLNSCSKLRFRTDIIVIVILQRSVTLTV